ncbi:Flp pilus assembly protein CpaB [Nocardioides mangrovicus]|uniref:Flp pilus assembly protein CpaB n=1 Tax=Nocardioides mangrovicus TaxID=2478913 RepID=A0A3L8P2S5_9ACTN|nr:Flp pilus assembly protein CpaB [Nocardioides mangrovicus]RLV49153.1 Flp pilus assembly protein CpaB [Nocardioides mangrovicus]
MDRRRVIVLVGALVAVLGTGVVYLYVKGADNRADQKFAAQQVLVAKVAIQPGETLAAAKTAGKLEVKSVTSGSVVPGAVANDAAISSKDVALTAIYPGEQILTSKFGAAAAASGSTLSIAKGQLAIAITMSDPNRVAGFLEPGDKVAIFATAGSASDATDNAKDGTRVLLPDVTVIAVGSTTTVATTTTDPTGAQTTEQVPSTQITLSLDQADAQKIIYTQSAGQTLTFGLLNKDSVVNKAQAPTNMSNLFN